MKLYTRTGDKGYTSLYDGNIIPKGSIFFDVLGDLDEISSHIGLLCVKLEELKNVDKIIDFLRKIQVKLLDIGSNIAVVKKNSKILEISDEDINDVENWIDECEKKNTKLTEFLITGINVIDSQCHVCRSIIRRTERNMWKFDECDNIIETKTGKNIEMMYVRIDEKILKYMNRLSDFFFALSRNFSFNKEIKVSDIRKK